jgi:hypothetical protein
MADTILPFKIITSSGEQVFPNVVDTTVDFGAGTNKIRFVISGTGSSASSTTELFNISTFNTAVITTAAAATASVSNVAVEKVYYTGSVWAARLLLTLASDSNSVQGYVDQTINQFFTNIVLGGGSTNDRWVPSSVGVAHTESTYAVKTVTGQSWVKANSFIDCKIVGLTSSDHTVEDGVLDGVQFDIDNIVVGTGFDIVGYATEGTYGKYSIRCLGY